VQASFRAEGISDRKRYHQPKRSITDSKDLVRDKVPEKQSLKVAEFPTGLPPLDSIIETEAWFNIPRPVVLAFNAVINRAEYTQLLCEELNNRIFKN
jgi:hypothetical protein